MTRTDDDLKAARRRSELLREARRNSDAVPRPPGVERIGEPVDISLGEGVDGEVRYFTVRRGTGLLIRSRWERGGHWLERMERTTGAWIDDSTLIDYFVGDDQWSGPDLDLTHISEAEAAEIALSLGGRLVPGEETRPDRFITRPDELVELELDE